MSTLFVVHVEDMFREYFGPDLLRNIRREVGQHRFTNVINLDSGMDTCRPIPEIAPVITEQWEWSWGYELECFEDANEHEWVIPANGHAWTWIPPELRNGRKFGKIYVCGGCEGECLQDWEDILDYVHLDYTKLPGCTYWA